MTVHQFVMMLMEACESVDMGDTQMLISTPIDDYAPYTIEWGEDEYGRDALKIQVLASEDEE
jgi:hypothetical protein